MARRRLLLAVLPLVVLLSGAAPAVPLRVAVISDLNGSYGSTTYDARVARAIEVIVDMGPDLVISTGDMVAGQRRPHLTEAEVRAMWDAFHRTVTEPLEAAGIPLAVTPGNHDASGYGGFEAERRLYAETWQRHRPALEYVEGDGYPFAYAFDLGGVRFASLDATTIGPLSGDQEAWLARTMGTGGETRVVFGHLPLWPVAIGRETEIIGDPGLARILSDLGVDLHLSGHHHAYYPGESGGIAFVAQACLGAGPRSLIGTGERAEPGFTLLEISADGVIEVSSLKAPDFRSRVEVGTLPPVIEGTGATLRRLDLSGHPTVRTTSSR